MRRTAEEALDDEDLVAAPREQQPNVQFAFLSF